MQNQGNPIKGKSEIKIQIKQASLHHPWKLAEDNIGSSNIVSNAECDISSQNYHQLNLLSE